MPRERVPPSVSPWDAGPGPSAWQSAGRRLRRLARAAVTLLRLELKVVSGNRTYVLVATAAARNNFV